MNQKEEILDRLDEAGYPENEFALQYDEFFADIEDALRFMPLKCLKT